MITLAIDFGLTRMGAAYSEGTLAQPIATYTAKTLTSKLNIIIELLRKYEPDEIVIGYPTGTLRPHIDRFVRTLKGQFRGTIKLVDETLTSRSAQENLIILGTTKRKRAKNLDGYAAALLLQHYLDES